MTATPKFKHPVPCVRLIARRGDGRLLVIRRAEGSFRGGEWVLPGGKVDYNESPEVAARRELYEETGFEPERLEYLFWQDSPPVEPGAMHALAFYYACRVEGEPVLSAESSDHAWLTPQDAVRAGLEFRGSEGISRWLAEGAKG